MSHKIADRNPMSEARRQHIHGSLLPLDPDRTFHWSIRAFYIGLTAAVCAYSAGWLS